jgi:hypothetical protein
MEIQGLDEFAKTLENASNNFDMKAEKAVGRVANRLIRDVKLKTPVDTGVLKRSWHVKMPQKLTRVVYNNCRYVSYVEYGHRTRGGKSFVDGVYMLERSVKEIEQELDKEFSIMIDNLFK